jgi:ribosomal protein S18 acetylase RimI-like enzyme
MSEGGGKGLDALIVRGARQDDLAFMQRMLYEAANRPGEDRPAFKDCMEEPRNRRHWVGLMTREGDVGVIAELSRAPVGAAWVRRMRGDELRPLDDPAVPVLAIAVESEYRGRGIGGRLMTALLERVRNTGTGAIDLNQDLEASVIAKRHSGDDDAAQLQLFRAGAHKPAQNDGCRSKRRAQNAHRGRCCRRVVRCCRS